MAMIPMFTVALATAGQLKRSIANRIEFRTPDIPINHRTGVIHRTMTAISSSSSGLNRANPPAMIRAMGSANHSIRVATPSKIRPNANRSAETKRP